MDVLGALILVRYGFHTVWSRIVDGRNRSIYDLCAGFSRKLSDAGGELVWMNLSSGRGVAHLVITANALCVEPIEILGDAGSHELALRLGIRLRQLLPFLLLISSIASIRLRTGRRW